MVGNFFIFSITGLVRIRPAMLHETKWFCRLVLFAVQLRKNTFLPSTKVSFWTEKLLSLKENWQIELLNL
jgi:hypothetical protein